MHKIRREKIIEGTTIPGFIRNGQYFYINVDIYEDGMVNCWELADLKGVREKIDLEWLTPQVPDGESISVFGLGDYRTIGGSWKHDAQSYYDYITELVQQLNPGMHNIYEVSFAEKMKKEKYKIVESPYAQDFFVESEVGYKVVTGEGFFIFMKYEGIDYLVYLTVYKDGTIECQNAVFQKILKLEELEELFSNGTFFTELKEPTKITLDHLGDVVMVNGSYIIDIEDKYKQVLDISQKLNKHPSLYDICRNRYYDYLENPTVENKEYLRKAYEVIPENERPRVAKTQAQHEDYIRILYTDQKREV